MSEDILNKLLNEIQENIPTTKEDVNFEVILMLMHAVREQVKYIEDMHKAIITNSGVISILELRISALEKEFLNKLN